jgi:hypothetical protein
MKKITLSIISVFVFAVCSFGQFSKGSILAGGSVGASFNTNKTTAGSITTTNYSQNVITFLPQGGYFFIDNLAGGAGIKLTSNYVKDDGSPASFSGTDLSFEPFLRYYYQKFYGQASVGFGSKKEVNTNKNSVPTTTKYSTSNWSFLAGYAIMLNDHVALEPQLGYQSTSSSPDGTTVTDKDSGLFLRLGIQVYIHK